MGLVDRADALIGLRAGERPMIGLLFVQYFFTGSASALTQAAGFALFLAAFNANQLPYTFMIMSVVISSLTTLYLQSDRFAGFAGQLTINLLGQMLVTAGFAAGLGFAGSGSWLVFCLPVLFQIVIVFGNMAFWSLAGRMLDVQQGKRLFGVLGTGEWLAMVMMGLLVPVLVPITGLANLLWLAVAAMAAALAAMTVNIRLHRHLLRETGGTREAEQKAPKSSILALLNNRYVLAIFCLTLLWWSGFFFVDNAFYAEAAIQFPQSEDLAGFIGRYLSIVGVLTVISNLFVAGPVVSRLGLRWSLLALPVGLAAGAAVMAATGSLSGPIVLLFVMAVCTKIWSVGVGFSVDQAARSILVQPFSASQRTRVQTLVDGVAQPVSTGAAGLLLLGLGGLFPASTLALVYGLLATAIAHVLVVVLVGRGYARALLDALSLRRLTGTEIAFADPDSRALLAAGLEHPHPGPVTYAMRMMAATDPEALTAALPRLLARQDHDVRLYAIEQAGTLQVVSLAPAIRAFVESDPAPDLKGAGLRALGRLGDSQLAISLLSDGQYTVRRAAVAVAIESGAAESARVLERLVASPTPDDRLQAALIMRDVPALIPESQFAVLLADPNGAVCRATLRALGDHKWVTLWPLVVAAVENKATASAATAALATGGAQCLPAITARLTSSLSAHTRAALCRVLGSIAGAEATGLLIPLAEDNNLLVRTAALAALVQCSPLPPVCSVLPLSPWVKREADFAAWAAAAHGDIEGVAQAALATAALRRHLHNSRGRMLSLLALVGDPEAVGRAGENLSSPEGRRRSYALEVLDIATPVALKSLVLPVLEDLSPVQLLQRLDRAAPQARMAASTRLEDIARNPGGILDDWTVASATYGLHQLMQASAPVLHDEAGADTNGRNHVLTTVEKVIMLRSASIFAETADDVLADVAAIAVDSVAQAGQRVLTKGEAGGSMYVIASGRVRVHDETKLLAELGPGEPFGEMALIDPEPRSASVSAVEDTILLRIDQDAFFELVDGRPEVARGLLRVLSRRLRNAN